MTPEERAERLVTSEAGIEAVRHCDTFAVEILVAAAIREAVAAERDRCARHAQDAADNSRTETTRFICTAIVSRIREGA